MSNTGTATTDDPMQLLRVGVAAAKQGETENARQCLQRLVGLDPNQDLAWLWLAHLASDTGERVRCLREALRARPDNEQAKATLARVLAHLGAAAAEQKETDQARQHLFEASHLDPAEKNVWLLLASVASSPDEAVSFLNKVIALEPKHQQATTWLKRIEQSTKAATSKPAEPVSTEGQNVLLVDDSKTIQRLVALTLEKKGHRVTIAENGMQALARLNDSHPDLILLDINMPHMDGFQLLKIIKKNDLIRHIPVVMLTGKDGFLDKLRGKSGGAVEYLVKPPKPAELLAVVQRHALVKVAEKQGPEEVLL